MKKSRKILAFFFSGLPSGTGRLPKKAGGRSDQILHVLLALSETKLETVPFEPSTEDTETMIQEIYQKLLEPPDSEEYLRLFPDGVLMKNYSFEGQTVTLNFDEEYKKMNNAREILVRTGMVLAFTQIPGVSYVEFQENGNPMTDSDGRELGLMERSSFVENEGKKYQFLCIRRSEPVFC